MALTPTTPRPRQEVALGHLFDAARLLNDAIRVAALEGVTVSLAVRSFSIPSGPKGQFVQIITDY